MTFNCTAAEKFRGCRFHEPFNGVPIRPMIVNGDVTFNDGFVRVGQSVNDYIKIPVDSSIIPTDIRSMTWITRIKNINYQISGSWIDAVLVAVGGYLNKWIFFGVLNNYLYIGVAGHFGKISLDTIDSTKEYFLVMTYNGSTFFVYVNGVLVGTQTTGGLNFGPILEMWIGGIENFAPCGGDVLEISVYNNVALTQQEIIDIYNRTTYHYINQFKLNIPMLNSTHDPSNNRTLDVSGYNNHAIFSSPSPVKIANRHGYIFNNILNKFTLQNNNVSLNPISNSFSFLFMIYNSGYFFDNSVLISNEETNHTFYIYRNYISEVITSYVVSSGVTNELSTTDAVNGGLHSIVVVIDQINQLHNIYIDGRLSATQYRATRNHIITGNPKIGTLFEYYTWKGEINAVAIIHSALTPLQIADWHCKMLALYNQE